MAAPTHLLVGNPTAQSGKNAERIAKARALIAAANVSCDFIPTQPAGGTVDAVAKALAAQPSLTTAIYMGGDGTFAEVAKGILRAGSGERVRVGMLPTGTANDQGRSFGLSADPAELERNIAVALGANEARLDAGKITARDAAGTVVREDLFFDSAGWGISPRVLHLRNEDRRAVEAIPLVREIWRDQLVYAGALLRTFLASYVDDGKFEVEVEADGATQVWRGLTDLVVKGTRIYGGLWVLDPASKPDDGRFEVVPFAGKRDWTSKALVALDHTGTTTEALAAIGVTHTAGISAAKIRMKFSAAGVPSRAPASAARRRSRAVDAQIDGEEFPATARVDIDVLPRVLRLVVP